MGVTARDTTPAVVRPKKKALLMSRKQLSVYAKARRLAKKWAGAIAIIVVLLAVLSWRYGSIRLTVVSPAVSVQFEANEP